MEKPGRLQSMGSLRVDTTERLHFHFSLSCIGEGNGNLLQCSCLENPRDGGAWWAAIYGAAQSRTLLKRLSSSIHWPEVFVPASKYMGNDPFSFFHIFTPTHTPMKLVDGIICLLLPQIFLNLSACCWLSARSTFRQ